MNIVVSLLIFIRKQNTKRAAQLVIRPRMKTTLYTAEYKSYLKESSIPQFSIPVSLITRLAMAAALTKAESPQNKSTSRPERGAISGKPGFYWGPLKSSPLQVILHHQTHKWGQSGYKPAQLLRPPAERKGKSTQWLPRCKRQNISGLQDVAYEFRAQNELHRTHFNATDDKKEFSLLP